MTHPAYTLTKREQIAATILAGVEANPGRAPSHQVNVDRAVLLADTLMLRLYAPDVIAPNPGDEAVMVGGQQ